MLCTKFHSIFYRIFNIRDRISTHNVWEGNFFELVFFILTLGLCIAYFYFNIYANTDLALGRFVLDMDERTAFNGVQKILHPINLENFFWSVRDGIDHRYGRIFWNSMAVASYLPEKIYGETGQIIASRGLQVLLLFLTACLLSYSLVNTWQARFAIFMAIFTIPFSAYYQTNPKPEPIQLFFISVFICYYFKKRMIFGKYWIFLGLAFGAKISTLPAVAIFFIASLLINRAHLIDRKNNVILNTVLWFVCGFSLAVPIFIPSFLILFGSYLAVQYLSEVINIKYRKQILLIILLFFLQYFIGR